MFFLFFLFVILLVASVSGFKIINTNFVFYGRGGGVHSKIDNSLVIFEFLRIDIFAFIFLVIVLFVVVLNYKALKSNNKVWGKEEVRSNPATTQQLFNTFTFHELALVEASLLALLAYAFFILLFIVSQDALMYFDHRFFFNFSLLVGLDTFLFKSIIIFLFTFLILFYKIEFSEIQNEFGIKPEKLFLVLSCLFFFLFISNVSDAVLLYVSFEALTFLFSLIIVFEYKSISIEAAIKYFILNIFSSILLLLGGFFIYSSILTLDYFHIKLFYLQYRGQLTFEVVLIGSICFITAFLFKLSVFPGILWVFDIYRACSLPLLFLISFVSKIVTFLVFLKLMLFVFYQLFLYWKVILLVSAFFSSVFSALGLLVEFNLKSFIAYSSIGQFSFLLLGLVNCDQFGGLQSLFSYLIFYILCNCLFFIILIYVCSVYEWKEAKVVDNEYYKIGSKQVVRAKQEAPLELSIYLFRSFYKSNFFAALILTACLLSFAGMPPLLGFYAKYQVFICLYNSAGLLPFIIFLIVNVFNALGYIKFVRIIWFSTAEKTKFKEKTDDKKETSAVSDLTGLFISRVRLFETYNYTWFMGILDSDDAEEHDSFYVRSIFTQSTLLLQLFVFQCFGFIFISFVNFLALILAAATL